MVLSKIIFEYTSICIYLKNKFKLITQVFGLK